MSDVLAIIGAGGMGVAIAHRTGAGKTILLADHNSATLAAAAATLRADGFMVDTHPVDVSSRESVAILARYAAELGTVRQVAHTAGLSPVQAPVNAIIEVDLVGVAYSIEEFGKVIAPGGAGIVIASMAGTSAGDALPAELQQTLATTPADELSTLPFLTTDALSDPGAAYGIAKRGNQLRMHAASVLWGQRSARINTISPGVIATAMGREELDGPSGDFMRRLVDVSAAQRPGTTSDIAAAAAFLLGPESTLITGTDLLVDGGVIAAVRQGLIEVPTA